MSNRLLASCVAIAMLGAGPVSGASAENTGFYFSITGGVASQDISKDDIGGGYADSLSEQLDAAGLVLVDFESTFDDSDAAWSMQAGYQWGSHVAVEVGYIDLGEAVYQADFVAGDPITLATAPFSTPIRFRNGGITAAAVGILPLGERFEVHGRAGMLFARNRIRERLVDASTGEVLDSFEFRGNSKDPFVGLGGSWNINDSYSLRLDYQRFLDVGDDEETIETDIDLISLSVQFR